MSRIFTIVFFLALLTSCVPNSDSNPNLHEITLYKQNGGIRYSYFYGSPDEKVKIEGVPIELQESLQDQELDDLVVPEALYADGKPYLQNSLISRRDTPFEANRYRYSSDILLNTNEPLEKVLYFDGELWFTLLEDSTINVNSQIVPQERLEGLEGVGELTQKEAYMLERYFTSLNKPIFIALLEDDLPAQNLSGFNEYRHTIFYVQEGISFEEKTFSAEIQSVRWDLLSSGDGALDKNGFSFVIITNDSTFNSVWNEAYAGELNLPKRPSVDFSRESILGIFLGVKDELGHAVGIDNIILEDDEVYAEVTITEPSSLIKSEGRISPWLMARIFKTNIEVVWIRNAETGDLVGIARPK